MFLSVFDIFKIGIGPSSSHTVGPMVAAARFLDELLHSDWPRPAGVAPGRISVSLHGSLAFTGKGHGTDKAVILGLCGAAPDSVDPGETDTIVARLARDKHLAATGCEAIVFDPDRDLIFDYDASIEWDGERNSIRLLDARLGATLVSDYLKLDVGQMRAPFGYETLLLKADIQFVATVE